MDNMRDMSYDLQLMPTTAFRDEVSEPKLRSLLNRSPVVRVGRYAQDEIAVVLAPEFFRDLIRDHEAIEALRTNLPMLLAAARAGIAIPSETLAPLGLADDDWETLNRFQAQTPVVMTHGEDGERLARGGDLASDAVFAEELNEELILLDD